MSYQLTYNESFILTVIMMIGGIWSIAVIFEGLSTVHDYDFKQTVVSLIITAVFMLIAAIVVVTIMQIINGIIPYAGIIYTCFNVPSPSVIIMWEQLYDFLITVGKEIIRNVTGS